MTSRHWLHNVFNSRTRRRIRKSQAGHRPVLEVLEDRCLLSMDPLVPASNAALDTIFWNGATPSNPTGAPFDPNGVKGITANPTTKTITITNTSNQTIYPILRDANTGQDPANTNTNNPNNYYDPQDPHNQEYREYIGYVGTDGKQYLGLPAGASITVKVPLVFWDAENTYIATDGTNLILPDGTDPSTVSNPFRYNPKSDRAVSVYGQSDSWVTGYTPSTGNTAGLVMFYHVKGAGPGDITSQTPALDSPSQLTEFTIRDPYLLNWLTEKDNAQEHVLFNYDVSYVDNLTSSIAMEATNVPIPIAGQTDPPTDKSYGWAGSSLIYGPPTQALTMQNLVQAFINNQGTANHPDPLLGQYFGGQGWPQYFDPNNTNNPNPVLKIPGGANIFGNSPLNGSISSYFTYGAGNAYMLTSAGAVAGDPGPIAVKPGGFADDSGTPTTIKLTLDPAMRDFLTSQLQLLLKSGQVNLQYVPDGGTPSAVVGTVTGYDPSGKLLGTRVTNMGSGYDQNKPPDVTITGGTDPTHPGGGTAHAVVDQNGAVTLVVPDNPGSYISEPTITIAKPLNGGIQATAIADIGGGTATIQLNPGQTLPAVAKSYIFSKDTKDYAAQDITDLWYAWAQYYVSQFTSDVFPPAGVTVKGSLTQGSNVLTLDPGTSVPANFALGLMAMSGNGIAPAPGTTVTILGFNQDPNRAQDQIYLSQVAASSTNPGTSYTFFAPTMLPFANTDAVKTITVNTPGQGYTPATVTFTSVNGSGSGAAGTVITSNGAVTGVVMTNYGSGYTAPPMVKFNGGDLANSATGTATIFTTGPQKGLVAGVTINNAGSGYLSVNIGGPGTGASAIATVDPVTKGITGVKIINGGTGYTSAPQVDIKFGGGSGATAMATTGSFVQPLPKGPLTFSQDQQAYAKAFAGTVYEALAAEGAIPNFTAKNPLLPGAYSLVYTTLGTDVLDLPNSIGQSGVTSVGTLVTNLIKSALRGVPDYTSSLYSDQSKWYPDPGDTKSLNGNGGQQFNPYNLDPYVWFVHTILGLSGYGFSTDDDTSDVGASASPYTPLDKQVLPSNLRYVFSGLDNLPNPLEWFPGVPYGTLTKVQGNVSHPTDGPNAGQAVLTLQPGDDKTYYQIAPPNLDAGQLGAYVSGGGIPAGTAVTVVRRDTSTGLGLVLSDKSVPDGPGMFTFSGKLITPTFTLPPPPPPPPPPPAPPPPPPPAAPGNTPGATVSSTPTSTAPLFQELIQLAFDEALLTIDQIIALADSLLGFVPDPALAASLAALTNAINTNPVTQTLLGQQVLNLSRLAILNFLAGGSPR